MPSLWLRVVSNYHFMTTITDFTYVRVSYSALGWSVQINDSFEWAITAKQAMYIIGAINRSLAICAMPANLRNV